MILGARLVFNSKKYLKCCMCNKVLDELHIRFYGMADYGDRPYVVHQHINCCNETDWLKLSDEHFNILVLNKDDLYKDKWWSKKR